MPEQAALSELLLSPAYRRCQRALALWLDQQGDVRFSLAAVRKAFRTLSEQEMSRLAAWLDHHLYAARHNHNSDLAARVERLASHLHRMASESIAATPSQTAKTVLVPHMRRSA